jgi:RNA polymerase sigma-70 factor, ECF subfamily
LTVVKAIRQGELREPERLMGFVRTVVRRQVAGHIERAVSNRRRDAGPEIGFTVADRKPNPEQAAMVHEQTELAKSALSVLSERDRDVLVRYYLNEQSEEQICREMNLTETQFRLTKSRAKAKFGEIGKKKLTSRGGLRALTHRLTFT